MSFYEYMNEKMRAIKALFIAEDDENEKAKKSYWSQFLGYFSKSEEEKKNEKKFPWGKYFNLTKDYFVNSDEKLYAWAYVIGIIICVIGFVALMAALSWWSAGFWGLLAAKVAGPPLYLAIGKLALLTTGIVTAWVAKNYFIGKLCILWRSWLTHKVKDELLSSNKKNLDVNRVSNMENIPTIIESDIKSFVELTVNLAADLLNSILSFGTFVSTLWVVGGALTLGTFVIPGYLVWVAIIVAIGATALTYFIGRSLIETNKEQENADADLRRVFETVIKDAENIALERAELFYQKSINNKMEKINKIGNQKLYTEAKLSAFQTYYQNIIETVPILLSLPLVLLGNIDIPKLMQILMSFLQVNSSVSWFANSYQGLSEYQAKVERIIALFDFLETEGLGANPKGIKVIKEDTEVIRTEIVNTLLPQSSSTKVIFKELDIVLEPGVHVVVTGDIGSGKSTWFKEIAGTYAHGEGKITIPKNKSICFLPQHPSLPLGTTLKEVLAYPDEVIYTDEQYTKALIDVGLPDEIPNLQTEETPDWTKKSGGERQLLSAARVLLKPPPNFLFLDESTSAMGTQREEVIYNKFLELSKTPSETTIFSIAHKPSVEKFHQSKIDFNIYKGDESKDKQEEIIDEISVAL
ncbi:MAG: ABC transporter ATP-binding protein/permease [Tatlockia sp.]|nr:ABC transporter ATP-binding protein/permease [Tatlockia sp.]